MFITYLIVSLVMGLFMAYIWSGKGFPNMLIKLFFMCYTVWTAALLLGASWHHIQAAIPNAKLF
jgi:biotin transporter BioY